MNLLRASTIVNNQSTRNLRGTPTVASVGRKVDVDQLVGASEIARRVGVKRPQVVHVWRQRYPDFPQPVATLDMGLVFYWPDVERWAKRTGRL